MIRKRRDNFSIDQICESGQCFRLKKTEDDWYALIAFGMYLELEEDGDEIIFHCAEEEFTQIWERYFDLNTDYKKVIDAVTDEDAYLHRAVQFGSGIRILEQEIWEIIISFIISQQNNIKRIRKCIETLCEKYGEKKMTPGGTHYFDFPSVAALAEATEEELRSCNLGYRSKYIVNTANCILKKEVDLDALKHMDYDDAKKTLMKLSGVGEKVADCICLFSLHHLDAFPVDTHIRKVLERFYPDGFPYEAYRGYSGMIQQYVFYYDLKGGE